MKFTRQKPPGNYVADFYCASQLLVIELDGDSHFVEAAQTYDARRTGSLAARGITVMRFTNLEVMLEFEGVCQRIREALAPVRLRLTTPYQGVKGESSLRSSVFSTFP